jgi:hypothetical protein
MLDSRNKLTRLKRQKRQMKLLENLKNQYLNKADLVLKELAKGRNIIRFRQGLVE